MSPRVGREEPDSVGITLVQLCRERVVRRPSVAIGERDSRIPDELEWTAVRARNIRSRVVDQGIAIVIVGESIAFRADIGDLENRVPAEIPLQVEIPLVDQRPPPLGVQRPERNRRRQRECIRRESVGELLDERVAVGGPLLDEARLLVERDVLTAIRVATLVLFGTVEDSVSGPDHGSRHHFVSESDPRSDV